jgi:NAD(P)-dependent dehydrogenase (short-subunit alcohol dehydrogenase family)
MRAPDGACGAPAPAARADPCKIAIADRLGTGDEIARAAVFLVSDDSSYIAGVELFLDGGFTQV